MAKTRICDCGEVTNHRSGICDGCRIMDRAEKNEYKRKEISGED